MRTVSNESKYYPAVRAFLEKQGYVCESKGKRKPIPFVTKGMGQIIMDVFGIKCLSSQLSTEIQVAAVEVKRGRERASLAT